MPKGPRFWKGYANVLNFRNTALDNLKSHLGNSSVIHNNMAANVALHSDSCRMSKIDYKLKTWSDSNNQSSTSCGSLNQKDWIQ